MTLGIGKQWEPPRRSGEWTQAKGDLNAVPRVAESEAKTLRERAGQPAGPRKAAPKAAPAPTPDAPPAPTTQSHPIPEVMSEVDSGWMADE